MIRLAIDTSGPQGAVAVAHGGEVLARSLLERRGKHAADLVPAIEAVLEEAGVDRDEIGGVIVGEGPGSFTGVRVAAATAKGLVHARGLPLWSVSSLAAAAMSLRAPTGESGDHRVVYALFDARGDRIYGGAYRSMPDGVDEFIAPHAGVLGEALKRPLPPSTLFVGDAAVRHRSLIEAAGFEVCDDLRSFADGLVRYQALTGGPPVDDPWSWEPSYVRLSSAERLWTT
jgi:tRNA threonylcarbamoyladenosine biosynthesis protein TsaB